MHCQARRNILAWGLHVPASQGARERNEGVLLLGNDGYYGPAADVTSPAQLQPLFLATQILSNPWDDSQLGEGRSQFYSRDVPGDPPHTEYTGDNIHSRIQLVAHKPDPADRSREYLKITLRRPYPYDWVSIPEVVGIEPRMLIIPAGKLTSEWVELVPPVVDGYEYTVSLEPVQLAVDANRDGKITFDGADATSKDKPFVFWVNDDHDVKDYMDLDIITRTLGQFDACDGVKDFRDGVITCTRDLEDFTRLHLSVACLADQIRCGSITVGLEFVQSTGNPSISPYLASEANGGMLYLLKNTVAEAQLADTKYSTTLGVVGKSYNFKFPSRCWETLSLSNPTSHMIFEGCEEGKGLLQFTFYKGDQKLASCGSLWIELKNIKKMYQRWNAKEVEKPGIQSDVWPSKSSSQDADSADPPPPQTDAEKDFVLFVHGWNMDKPEKRAFAETAYKRLWQLGYMGRFGAYFWPTFYEGGIDPRNYNGSEHRAWASSDALLGLLQQLNQKYPGRVNIVAHSMGNVVTSEALRKASNVVARNYVASQAALPADVFKLNQDITEKWNSILATTLIGYNVKLPFAKDVATPNVYAYYFPDTREFSYCTKQFPQMGRPYMAGIGGAAKWHNYMNPNDWALGLWIYNQSQKPTSNVFTFSSASARDYSYRYHDGLGRIWSFWADEAGFFDNHGIYIGERGDSPDSTYEIFSYCAQARSNPVGRQNNIGGAFSFQKIYSDYGDKHPGHSAQFLEAICNRWIYWNDLLTDCEICHTKNLGEF